MHFDASTSSSSADGHNTNEQLWFELSSWLFPLVHMWVCYSGILSWRGQFKEIAEEIVQEAVLRTFKYTQRAERGEVSAVISLKSLSKVIAQNHFRDRCKKDCHLIHPEQNELWEESAFVGASDDPSQIAYEQMASHATLVTAAQVVVNFPRRQRLALLTDLANTHEPGDLPSPLEKAFLAVGVELRDYHRPLPTDHAERGKHSALLCIAYKRLRHSMQLAAS